MKKIIAALTIALLLLPSHLLAVPKSSAYQAGYAAGHFVGRAIVILGICAIVFLLIKRLRNRK